MLHYQLSSPLAHCFISCIRTYPLIYLPNLTYHHITFNCYEWCERESGSRMRARVEKNRFSYSFMLHPFPCRFVFVWLVVFYFFFFCVFLKCRISWIIFLKMNWKNFSDINSCFSLIHLSLLELNTLKMFFDSFLQIALIWGFFKNIQQTSALNQGNNETICDITLGNHAL